MGVACAATKGLVWSMLVLQLETVFIVLLPGNRWRPLTQVQITLKILLQ